MTFGEKLKEARKAKKITQQELGKLTNISLNTICNYEKGKTYPQNREAYATLAKALDVDADYLHNENDEFVLNASKIYGTHGRAQAEELINAIGGLFAGGELSEEDKDGVMRALQEIYWECKEENTTKYTPKKYRNKGKK